MNSFQLSKHEKYFNLCLTSLPSKAQSEDSNILSIVFFALQGLDLIGKFNLSDKEIETYTKSIYEFVIDNEEFQGFRATQTFKLQDSNEYDVPNLASTFFGLLILLQLKSDYTKILDREKIMKFLKRLQVNDPEDPDYGSIKPSLDQNGQRFGESDLRHCYTGLCIRKLMKYDDIPLENRVNDINLELLEKYIVERIGFNGGMSSQIGTEPHAGLTYCGIAALKLLGHNFNDNWVDETINWLVHRQVDYPESIDIYKQLKLEEVYEYWDLEDAGGFNGRENKYSDTCYAWWTCASLKLLKGKEGVGLIDIERAEQYLLAGTQGKFLGGFGKNAESYSDPYHSYLGIAALSVLKAGGGGYYEESSSIKQVDELLAASESSIQFLNQIKF